MRCAVLLLASSLLLPAGASAGSAFRFTRPELVGEISAETYDEAGARVGPAEMRIDSVEGEVRLFGRSAMDESAQAEFGAAFRPESGGLRLLRQHSESRDLKGESLGRMTIDHIAGTATCGSPPGSDGAPLELALPRDDRVVNIPLNLLFDPLVQGERESIDFQLLLCRVGGGRFVDARAWVVQASPDGPVEVRYEVDLGPILSRIAAPFMPDLSFWFDRKSPGGWIGHRMPLFTQGPTVTVVRSGFAPIVLTPEE